MQAEQLDRFEEPAWRGGSLGVREEAMWLHIPVVAPRQPESHWVLTVEYGSVQELDIVVARAGQVLRIGRSPDNGFVVDHHSVSRNHAELSGVDGAWDLVDLGSSNGSFVDDRRVLKARLPESAWLRFGEVYCLYEQISDADAAAIEQQRDARGASNGVLLSHRAATDRICYPRQRSMHAVARPGRGGSVIRRCREASAYDKPHTIQTARIVRSGRRDRVR